MSYNLKVQSRLANYRDGEVHHTTVVVVDTNSLLQIPADLIGDYTQKSDNEIIEATLDYLHKTLYSDRALPEYIRMTDNNIKRIDNLESQLKKTNVDLEALRTFVFKKDKNTISEATAKPEDTHEVDVEIEQ